jgi:DnaJ-class molecular chaperone
MSDDYYQILGVSRDATQDEIAKAYRKKARKYHPDMNQDDARAKERFQEIQGAFDVLSDQKKKSQYDQFGSDFENVGRAGGAGFGGMDLEEILRGGRGSFGMEDIVWQFGGGPPATAPRRGSNLQQELEISFHMAVLGGEVQVSVAGKGGKRERIRVKIPAGIENGKKVRVGGKGEPSRGGGSPGDLLIKVQIADHPCFRRRGRDLELDLPLTISEAIRGAAVDVPTPYGTITLKVPAGTSSGKRLRIKDHGIRTGSSSGHLYAVAQVHLPPDADKVESDILEKLEQYYPDSPRGGLRWE